jgi:hypothetical protein
MNDHIDESYLDDESREPAVPEIVSVLRKHPNLLEQAAQEILKLEAAYHAAVSPMLREIRITGPEYTLRLPVYNLQVVDGVLLAQTDTKMPEKPVYVSTTYTGLASANLTWKSRPTTCTQVPTGLPVQQEPKYTVSGTHIVNRQSGEVIPHDEPVFILRAKDKFAINALKSYHAAIRVSRVVGNEHKDAVFVRAKHFQAFAQNHPERMGAPNTVSKEYSQPCQPDKSKAAVHAMAEIVELLDIDGDDYAEAVREVRSLVKLRYNKAAKRPSKDVWNLRPLLDLSNAHHISTNYSNEARNVTIHWPMDTTLLDLAKHNEALTTMLNNAKD